MGNESAGLTWVVYALMTVVAWGVYGIFIHKGQVLMGDPANGRYKAFLFVGGAYFFIAVLAPIAVLLKNGASWSFTPGGTLWSLIAGIAGAVGAFCVLLAFGARGTPAAVMSIIFAGAPIVNAFVSLVMQPPAAGLSSIRPQFIIGILLAAIGGCLVALYKPGDPPGPKPTASVSRPAHGSESTGTP